MGCEDSPQANKTQQNKQQITPPMDKQYQSNPRTEVAFGDLDKIRERGLLRVLVTHSRTDFFVDQGKIRGIQAEFVNALEKQLNAGITDVSKKLRIEFHPVSFAQLIPTLVAGKGDLIANFLTVTPEREQQVDFLSGENSAVNEILVSHNAITNIKSLDDLAGREIHLLRNSSYVTHLTSLNKAFKQRGLKPINIIQEDSQLLSEDILELVNAGIYQLTIIDDYRAKAWQKTLPNLSLYTDFPLSKDNTIGWAIGKNSPLLTQQLKIFIAKNKTGTLIGNLLFTRYFKKSQWIKNPNDPSAQQRLEEYRAFFKTYAMQYGHDKHLLKAVAFQESGLDHSQKSHRGAVGLMQLLPTTAADKMVNIPDISSPKNNIHAGAKYLAFIRDRYFSSPTISKKDRQAFMLAAYNAGPAKVRRMRELANAQGLNPDIWHGHVDIIASQLIGRERLPMCLTSISITLPINSLNN